MTNAEIIAEFDRLWQAQKSNPRYRQTGPDADEILHIITAKSDKTLSQVRAIVRDGIFTPPN